MLNASDWMSVSQKMKYNTLLMISKMKNGMLPKYMNDNVIFVSQIHIHTFDVVTDILGCL